MAFEDQKAEIALQLTLKVVDQIKFTEANVAGGRTRKSTEDVGAEVGKLFNAIYAEINPTVQIRTIGQAFAPDQDS